MPNHYTEDNKYQKGSFSWFERTIRAILMLSAGFSILVTILIIASIFFETVRFFQIIPFHEFLFGTDWSPQTALQFDKTVKLDSFGVLPVLGGTLLITLIAILVAGPLGLMAAIYLSQYASTRFRNYTKPTLEILAGVPTVVYGYFAVVTFSPFLRELGQNIHLSIASESALAAGIVMGIMIIPFVMSLSEDVISAVPKSLKYGSLSLGATRSETICRVVLPAALPGIVSALLLGISRGIGETMIVVMAAGLAANLTINPLEAVTTVTAQIVTLLVGDHEFDSAKTLAAFALGSTLFFITLCLNIIALMVVKKYQERYE